MGEGFRVPDWENEMIERLDTMNGHLEEISKHLKALVEIKGKEVGLL